MISIHEDGTITYLPGISLSVDEDASQQSLVITVSSVREDIAKIYYKTDTRNTVVRYTG